MDPGEVGRAPVSSSLRSLELSLSWAWVGFGEWLCVCSYSAFLFSSIEEILGILGISSIFAGDDRL